MLSLAGVTWILGILTLGGGIFTAAAPALTRRGMEQFPRSVWPGRVLLAIDMVWSAYAVAQMHLGGFDAAKVHLYWIAPVCIVLGCLYLDELLSVRALGGLLLLAAGPLLAAARNCSSAGWQVMSALAYIWIGVGLLWLLEPWWFRRIVQMIRSDTAMRACGIFKTMVGVALVVLAVMAY